MIVFLVLLLFEIKYNYMLSRMGALWSMDKKLVMLRAQIIVIMLCFCARCFSPHSASHPRVHICYLLGSESLCEKTVL